LKFIDLFCGIGGFRVALESLGCECVFSSEINSQAIKVYKENFNDTPNGDITQIPSSNIPDHDILCAGFPCQPFSASGLKKGFDDRRGQLIFEVVRILKSKQPSAFILENVKGLVRLDSGKALQRILFELSNVGYTGSYKILDSQFYGVPQRRKRLYIVGFRKDLCVTNFDFPNGMQTSLRIRDILEHDLQNEYLWLTQGELDYIERHSERSKLKKNKWGFILNHADGISNTLVVSNGGQKNNLIVDKNIPLLYRNTTKKRNAFLR
jgi:DNA (cytosine-5)-methyltransferase 1